MTISHTPAPARSDVRAVTDSARIETHPYRTHGLVLAGGAAAWAAGIAIFGLNPHSPVGLVGYGLTSGAFQVGLLILIRVLWRTQALGGGRIARGVLRVETVIVSLAMMSTFVDAIGVSNLDQLGWLLLDLNWPLSMLGMFFIGIRIAIAGRWRGVSRYWPMVAESWAVVNIPIMAIFGMEVVTVTAALHLLVGYAVLGLIVSRKER